jgi:hypothetical protein
MPYGAALLDSLKKIILVIKNGLGPAANERTKGNPITSQLPQNKNAHEQFRRHPQIH